MQAEIAFSNRFATKEALRDLSFQFDEISETLSKSNAVGATQKQLSEKHDSLLELITQNHQFVKSTFVSKVDAELDQKDFEVRFDRSQHTQIAIKEEN